MLVKCQSGSDRPCRHELSARESVLAQLLRVVQRRSQFSGRFLVIPTTFVWLA